MAPQAIRRRIDPSAERHIRRLAMEGLSPAEIEADVERAFAGGAAAQPPSLRTIQRMVTEIQGSEDSALWSLADADEEAPAIAEVLVAAIEESQGRRSQLTRAEARWIPRVRLLAVDLPPWIVLRLAQGYAEREARSEGTADVDAFLAFAPWRNQERRERYHDAADADRLPGDQVTLAWITMSVPLLPRAMREGFDWNTATDAERELRIFASDASRRFDDRMAERNG